MKYIIVTILLFFYQTVGFPFLYDPTYLLAQNTNKDSLLSQKIEKYALTYYKKQLQNTNYKNLVIENNGTKSIKYRGEECICYNICIRYSIFENEDCIQKHYKNWFWILDTNICLYLSDFSNKGQIGMWTTGNYLNYSNKSLAKKVRKLLKHHLFLKEAKTDVKGYRQYRFTY